MPPLIQLTDREFAEIAGYIRSRYGINLFQKRTLIEARMNSLLGKLGMNNFTEFLRAMERDAKLAAELVNRLTTNHTYFMREPDHYAFLRNVFLPEKTAARPRGELRIWSAGCSSGEEAFTAVMQIKEFLGSRESFWDYRILATDISEKAMAKAETAEYDVDQLTNLPPGWLEKYFEKTPAGKFRVTRDVKSRVLFRKFNLMEPFLFQKPMDLIFCRNVMIYFEQPTRDMLAKKFFEALAPGGYLIIGLSETLRRGEHPYRYLHSSIYQRPPG